jgi:hypothetical protein
MVVLLRGPLLPERRSVVYFSYAKRSRIQKQREAGMAVEKAVRPELDDIARKLRRPLEGVQ